MIRVDLRTVALEVPPQDVITRDNVPVTVTAVVYFRVVHPSAAVVQVEDYTEAASQIAQTTLRSILGQHSLDESSPSEIRSTRSCRRSSTSRPSRGASRCRWSRSRTSSCPGRCSGRSAGRRGRARAPGQDHQRSGRVRGRREARPGRRHHRREPDRPAASLPQTLLEVSSSENSTTILPVPMEIVRPSPREGARGRACAATTGRRADEAPAARPHRAPAPDPSPRVLQQRAVRPGPSCVRRHAQRRSAVDRVGARASTSACRLAAGRRRGHRPSRRQPDAARTRDGRADRRDARCRARGARRRARPSGMYISNAVTGEGFAPRTGLRRSRIAELLPSATMPTSGPRTAGGRAPREPEARALRVARVAARLREEAASSPPGATWPS